MASTSAVQRAKSSISSARVEAPACERNKGPILDVLKKYLTVRQLPIWGHFLVSPYQSATSYFEEVKFSESPVHLMDEKQEASMSASTYRHAMAHPNMTTEMAQAHCQLSILTICLPTKGQGREGAGSGKRYRSALRPLCACLSQLVMATI
eukprot:1141113-Pelagomonas_calceolata.AAC.10